MVRTSTAEANNYVCPRCKDELNHDHSNRGYVSHRRNRQCTFEKGQRDDLSAWRKTTNDDNGSLRTGGLQLKVGSVIEILGEDRERTVTYVMGSDRNGWRACFRNQGAVPVGHLEWRVVHLSDSKRPRFFDFHTAKGMAEFIAAVIGIIAGIVAFITWLF